ncbi:MAG: hypothetical protein Q9195_003544 [Heterodermia aff. obscurata]
MLTLPLAAAFLLPFAAHVSSTPPAALLGPAFSAPKDLSSNSSLVHAAWSNFTATIESYIRANTTVEGLVPDLGSYTFSVGAFSIYDNAATEKLQYHHTGPDVKTSNTGVTDVDGDSIYRVESITKLFTVYLTLLEIGSGYWDCPITDFLPDLAAFAKKTPLDPLHVVDWKGVTLGTLAGQISGIPRDTALYVDDLSIGYSVSGLPQLAAGLPPLNFTSPDEIDPCLSYSNSTGTFCPTSIHLQSYTRRDPVFAPWTSPMYTNGGFALLSLAVENITGKAFGTLFEDDMFKPLAMTSTFYKTMTDFSRAVSPGGNDTAAYQSLRTIAANDAASGSIYSTTNDLAKFGISILNATLLAPEETRKWLKPITHTGSLQFSVGRPWEIFRFIQPSTGHVNDLYTKAGDGTGYSSYLILSPDHGAGFSILIAGNQTTFIARSAVADALTSTVVRALESEAAAESVQNFAGRYVSNSTYLNSSVTLSVDASTGSGLHVTSWISNGTDMFPFLETLTGDKLSLFPTGLRSALSGQMEKIAFRGTFSSSQYSQDVGLFVDQTTTNGAWENIDATAYGGASLDLFLFDVDTCGKATAVRPAITRATLHKIA